MYPLDIAGNGLAEVAWLAVVIGVACKLIKNLDINGFGQQLIFSGQ